MLTEKEEDAIRRAIGIMETVYMDGQPLYAESTDALEGLLKKSKVLRSQTANKARPRPPFNYSPYDK